MLFIALAIASFGPHFDDAASLLDVAAPSLDSAEVELPARFPAAAPSWEERSNFSYTYVEIGATTLDLDETTSTKDSVDTYYFRASLGLGLFHIFGAYEYQTFNYQDTRGDLYRLGAGAHLELTKGLDAVGEAAWLYSDLSSDLSTLDGSSNGFEGKAGLRWMPLPWDGGGLELDGNFVYVDLENRLASNDAGSGWEAGAQLHFLEMFSMGLVYSIVDNDDKVSINARFSF